MLAEQESVARRSVVRGAVALVVTLAVALVHISGPGVAPSTAQSVMEGGAGSIEADPQPGPFYHADPQHLADAPLGEVINSRDVTMPAFLGYRVTEIAYRSTDSRDRPLLATATVVRPHHARPDGPVLSYQHYRNALGQRCAPTETLVHPTLETVQDNAMVFLRTRLDQGWTVIIPDHLGPKVAYPGGQLSGRIVLDGMRAVRDDPRFDSRHSRFGALGYSGGGIASAWVSLLHDDYAPDVNLVGVAQGGVPTDMTTMARMVGNWPHPAFGLAFAAAVGMAREYPEAIRLEEKLTPDGWALYSQLKGRCTATLLTVGAFRSVPMVLRGGDLLAEEGLMRAFAENSIRQSPDVPRVPVFMWHSGTDPLVPFWDAEETAKRYCREGAPLTWEPGLAPEHLMGAVEKLPAAMNWLQQRFDGVPAGRACYV
ncbi:lipase family protein [Dietzia kunjamensis]|uniref:lipase family protein n=1 Tax=Dietzia kunjamensis TaxID=322509 RepID=UPI0015F864AB|nr:MULTISPECIES: lipase family protein [Dietzia]MBB1018966.1 lipase [Dietzia sp. DQ11-71]MDJ0422259.1 lipase family protein [Dietzia kunjamensis]